MNVSLLVILASPSAVLIDSAFCCGEDAETAAERNAD